MNKIINYFHRKPYNFHFSIEQLFSNIQSQFSSEISCNNVILPYYSKGMLSRIKNGLFAKQKQGLINHITGDIHFITPFLSKKRTINTYHDFTFLKNSKGISRFILCFFWVYLPVKRSKYLTTISETTKQELIKYGRCKPEKIVVIPNIISNQYKAVKKTFNKECPTILHIGTTPNKNLDRLINALEGVRCNLQIIGKLNDTTTTLLKQNDINYINQFQIPEEKLRQAYIDCDLLSFCSLNEGFGLPILEAQATGRPVITSNLSSMPEVAGDAACFVDPYNTDSIKEGIEKVIANEEYRNTLISKGLENVKRFNPKVVASQYEALYNKIYSELQSNK
ncbi:glycosyltransferase family 4 protein [Plebeiibacterium sediminum]|uniref:Glycosyltransferase family 4 protein n=1 Tax=Plebeiibacterium sediminum TaxID=2992112 RepID=A0AAE3M8U5_9BACT|nr:glycosyltransferase family 1 protein [Plebeiobacterium sediminum]MCW3789203.1 glycosyltransferase family 4 protein [Plebeiobacterium sediminum]